MTRAESIERTRNLIAASPDNVGAARAALLATAIAIQHATDQRGNINGVELVGILLDVAGFPISATTSPANRV